jgi:hypothetical protein
MNSGLGNVSSFSKAIRVYGIGIYEPNPYIAFILKELAVRISPSIHSTLFDLKIFSDVGQKSKTKYFLFSLVVLLVCWYIFVSCSCVCIKVKRYKESGYYTSC